VRARVCVLCFLRFFCFVLIFLCCFLSSPVTKCDRFSSSVRQSVIRPSSVSFYFK
jgi:hypothetical protein